LLLHWLLSALSLLIVAHIVPGFQVAGFGTALLASVVIGLVNGTLGLLLKIITLPVSILTFGLFFFVINALMIKMAASIVPGFHVLGFGAALLGAIVLALLNALLRSLLLD
jgi:putative membrane protein